MFVWKEVPKYDQGENLPVLEHHTLHTDKVFRWTILELGL
jgi:hypothetical protein